jgi:hypothetical protein
MKNGKNQKQEMRQTMMRRNKGTLELVSQNGVEVEDIVEKIPEDGDVFPNLSSLKYLKVYAGIYLTMMHYNSLLLKVAEPEPEIPDISKIHQAEVEIDFEIDFKNTFRKIFNLDYVVENSPLENNVLGRSVEHWSRFDERKWLGRLLKSKFPKLKTKQDVIKGFQASFPSEVKGLFSVLESLVRQKRLGEVNLKFPQENAQNVGKQIFASIRQQKAKLENMAIALETSLVNPEMNSLDIGAFIIDLVQLERRRTIEISQSMLQLSEAIQLGEITDEEIQAALDSKAGLVEFDERIAEKKAEGDAEETEQ